MDVINKNRKGLDFISLVKIIILIFSVAFRKDSVAAERVPKKHTASGFDLIVKRTKAQIVDLSTVVSIIFASVSTLQ